MPIDETATQRRIAAIALIVTAAAMVLRFLELDADPYFRYWIGYITDEGRWTETARSLVLFGDPGLYGLSRLHLLLAPAFQAVEWVVFSVFGVGFWSARLFPAISGALVVIAFWTLRRRVSAWPWLMGVVVLAFEPTLLDLSRVALPETPALLCTLLAFLVLALRPQSRWSAPVAGLIFVLGIGMKATTLFVTPAFVLVAAMADGQATWRGRALRAAGFLAALVVPALAALAAALVIGVVDVHGIAASMGSASHMLHVASVYEIVDRLLRPEQATVQGLALGAWLASWCLVDAAPWRHSATARLYLLSGIWTLGWLVAWLPMDYLPDRYFVHLVVPGVIHVAAGLSLLVQVDRRRLIESFTERRGAVSELRRLWLVAPAAFTLVSTLAPLVTRAGLPLDRLVSRLGVSLLIAIALGWLLRTTRHRVSVLEGLLLWPIGVWVLWLGGSSVNWLSGSWLLPIPQEALRAVAVVIGAAVLVVGLHHRSARFHASWLTALVAIAWFANWQPAVLRSTFTIRDTSRHLARTLSGVPAPIGSDTASSFFLETPLRYTDEPHTPHELRAIVYFFPGMRRRGAPPGEPFEIRERFEVDINPRYLASDSLKSVDVGVYVRDVP